MSRDLPSDFDVDYQLTRLVRQVRARSLRNLADIHPRLDYSTFILLLAVVDAPEGARASELAEAMRVHKSTVSRAVSALERMGLVERRPDPRDGRSHVLTASAHAQERVESYRRTSHAWLATLIEDWSPQDLGSFARQLGRLNDAMDSRP